MLDYISRIGIFMIAAQAMVHFAPGKQYEKYIKSVAGIIILVLFLRPFLQFFGMHPEKPQAVLERLEEWMDMPDFTIAETSDSVDAEVVGRMEEEVKELLNRDLEGEDYYVGSVSIRLETDQEQEVFLSVVEARLAERSEGNGEEQIQIDEIVVGGEQELSSREVFSAYRERFAKILGIEKERVEVRWDGGSKKAF